jgi:hypothetical protein
MQDLPEIPDDSGFSPTELFLWQLCARYAQQYPKTDEPVRSELVAAFVPRMVRLLALKNFGRDVLKTVEYAIEVLPEARGAMMAEAANVLKLETRELISQLVELDSWLHEPGVNEIECGNWLTASGYSYDGTSKLIEKAKKMQRGRPPIKRQTTVAGLDARKRDAKLSWQALANQLCDCGRPDHDERCSETLRKSAAQLEKVLKKYREAPIPAELFARAAQLLLDRMGSRRHH